MSSAALSVAGIAVVVAAIAANGFPVDHVVANDGAIWVTDNSLGSYARFDYPVAELDAGFGPPGAFQSAYDLDVLQEGPTVLAIDRNRGDLYSVDVDAGALIEPGVPLPGGADADVALGGGVVAVLDTDSGKLWAAVVGSGTPASLASLNTSAAPLVTVDGASALVVGQDGTVDVASQHELVSIADTAGALGKPQRTALHGDLDPDLQLTAVGTTAVILDPGNAEVLVPSTGRTVNIPGATGSSADAIQQAGPASASVLVATASTLYRLPLDGGRIETVAGGGAGVPAQPVVLGDCVHAAWAGTPGVYARSCAGSPPYDADLPGGLTLGEPVFRVNNAEIVLNDLADGATWSLGGTPALALNAGDWQKLLTGSEHLNQQPSQTASAVAAPEDQPPKAVDETLEARSGRTTVLHILDGDSDPAGSVLSIASVTPPAGTGFSVQIAPDMQTVAVTLEQGEVAPIHFQYAIVDARGQSATATVTVTPTTAETPPHLRAGFTPPIRHVSSGATVAYQVLGDWRDDEGDPLTVTDVSASLGQVTATDDGLLTYAAPVVEADTVVTVVYHVTDGLSAPVAGQIDLTLLGRGDITEYPPVAIADAAEVVVGQAAVLDPLLNDIPGADPLHPDAQIILAGPVAAPTGLDVSTDVSTGQLTLTALQPGIYSLTYQDAFGSAPLAQGQILVDARAANGTPASPVTIPSAVLLRGQMASTVDVLANDYDPAGGLLTVVGATAPAGVEVAVIDGEWLRLVATTTALVGQQLVDYEVTNGNTDPVEGQVTATWLPAPASAPPVAPTMYATVRAGDETDVPVLQGATDPDGEPLELVPGAVTISPPGTGAASIEGAQLRYAAPLPASVTSVEQVDVDYQVEDTSGETTTGEVVVTVNPADSAHDAAPVPGEVDARVVAGGTLTIPIPTTGVDPDGDSVAVSGVVIPPQLGRILGVAAGSITYQAYPLSHGTDTLTYQVESSFGLTGEAEVRIAVTPPALVPAPVAVDDSVIAAPGSSVTIDVLAIDIIAPGDEATVEPLSRTNATVPPGAELIGNDLRVTAPMGAEPLVIAYGITDGTASSVAHVTVRAQTGYITPPVAIDDYPPAPAAGQTSITVDVLADDYDPASTTNDLTVAEVFDADVKIVDDRLVIPVGADPRSVAYLVRTPAGGTAVGVVHVPGTSTGPTLRAGGTIQVPASGSVVVDINDYISDSRGRVQLVSSSDVYTTPESGLAWQPDTYTSLSLSAQGGYLGPGALTVEVTDATSPGDTHAQTAAVTIPVQVGPSTPVLRCPTTPIQVTEGGTPVSLDLPSVCAVWTPTPDGAASLTFTSKWASAQPSGVSLGWADAAHQDLEVTAASAAQPGSAGDVTVGISGTSVTATLSVDVVAAPPPTIAAITVPAVETGQTAAVDVSQYVTSPLADPKILVVEVEQTSGQSVPTPRISGSVVQFSPQPGTHGTMTFSVEVTDVPGRADRTVIGEMTLQVLDAPGAATDLQGDVGNQQVALSWVAAPDNGSPVDHYVVSVAGGASTDVAGTSYTWTGLTNGITYQFTVTAHNQVGLSTTSVTGSFMPQSAPSATGAVTATPGDGEVALSWTAANPNGRAIDSYLITVNPAPQSGSALQTVSGTATSYTFSGLDNNVGPYTFTVTAHNALGPGPPTQSSAVYTYGTPATPSAPTAAAQVSPDQTTTTITVTWPAVGLCNDAQPCASYAVTELVNGSTGQTVTETSACSGSQFCATFPSITNNGDRYTYTVQDVNREGEKSAESAPSEPAIAADGVPAPIEDLAVSHGDQSLTATFVLPASHGASITTVEYTAANTSGGSNASGSWPSPGASGNQVDETISGLVNGDTYSVTVEACNEAGECGSPSNAATGLPYGPPYAPWVTAVASGNTVIYSWGGGGDNGLGVQTYAVFVDSTPVMDMSAPGSYSYTYSCGQTHSVYAYVQDTAGEDSPNSGPASAATQACAPPQTVTVSEGAEDTSYSSCTSTACHLIDVAVSGFAPGTYTVWYSSDCAGHTDTLCDDYGAGSPENFISEKLTVGANGQGSSAAAVFGFPNSHVWVNVGAQWPGGVESNHVTWSAT